MKIKSVHTIVFRAFRPKASDEGYAGMDVGCYVLNADCTQTAIDVAREELKKTPLWYSGGGSDVPDVCAAYCNLISAVPQTGADYRLYFDSFVFLAPF